MLMLILVMSAVLGGDHGVNGHSVDFDEGIGADVGCGNEDVDGDGGGVEHGVGGHGVDTDYGVNDDVHYDGGAKKDDDNVDYDGTDDYDADCKDDVE